MIVLIPIARNMEDSEYVSIPMLGSMNWREIMTEQEIQFLDEDVFYQQDCDERDRYWWEAQDKEAQNKSLQKWFEFLQENFK